MKRCVHDALSRVIGGLEGTPAGFEAELMACARPEQGDLATNCALQLARHLRRNPREIAADIVGKLQSLRICDGHIASVEIAGPGFINFRFSTAYWHQALDALLAAGEGYGRSASHAGARALVEFVSANPTGPLTVGHGRNAVLGDTIANLLEWTGFQVTREYYFNDAGRQMRVLGASVRGRYHETLADPDHVLAHMPKVAAHRAGYTTKCIGDADAPVTVASAFPDDGYLGTYITEIAAQLAEAHGADLLEAADERTFTQAAKQAIFADIESTLERLGIAMDRFFNEGSLYESGAVRQTLRDLCAKGVVYERDGAQWMKTSTLGKEKDTVLVKSTGETTYRLPDMAYHRDKYERGYDVMIDIFGADHIATYPDVLRALYQAEVHGLTVSRVRGHGGEVESVQTYRGTTVKMELRDKIMLDIGVSDEFVSTTVDAICDSAATGSVGDGKIFVLPVDQVIRVRTREEDQAAVTPER